MSQENVEVVRRWVALFNERGEVAEFLSLLDPEVELQTPGGTMNERQHPACWTRPLISRASTAPTCAAYSTSRIRNTAGFSRFAPGSSA
jgi:hypothetical protein